MNAKPHAKSIASTIPISCRTSTTQMLQNASATSRRSLWTATRCQILSATSIRLHPHLKCAPTRTGPQTPFTNFEKRSKFHAQSRSSYSLLDDTIYALSTAPGRAGIAIVRISGPACLDIYRGLCRLKPLPKARCASLRTLHDPLNESNVLDSDALVLYFPTPSTVTGEEVLELHIHGGPATVKAVLSAIPKCSSGGTIRYAEPGEFTKRAFMNDKLDLSQVEALSDTLSAETEQQRRAAVRGNFGELGRTYESWRQQLLYARGELEALIDFSEDQHFDESPAELLSSVTAQIEIMLNSIASHDAAGQRGELLKKGIRISLLGPPNAGKSSLLNQIVGREASIVSHEAGTTRDVVEVGLDIQGYFCTFADTAGLRSGSGNSKKTRRTKSVIGDVELEGIRRAMAKAGESDLVIALTSVQPDSGGWSIDVDLETIKVAQAAPQSIIVVNKNDTESKSRVGSEEIVRFRQAINDFQTPVIPISCKDAQQNPTSGADTGNINKLIDQLVETFRNMTAVPVGMEDLLGVTERQRQLLVSCSEHLNHFIDEAKSQEIDCDIVLAAEHLRSAANCLSRITGRGEASDVEEVLGVVFEKFCVGK